MVNFAKLNDPVYRAKMKALREVDEAAAETHDKKIRDALNLFSGGERFGALSLKEQEFIDSCGKSVRGGRSLSEKQEKWLFDIAKQASGEVL